MKLKLDDADKWLKENSETAKSQAEKRRAKRLRKKARRGPSPYAPEKQDSLLFWQEVWRQKQALRERLGDSA